MFLLPSERTRVGKSLRLSLYFEFEIHKVVNTKRKKNRENLLWETVERGEKMWGEKRKKTDRQIVV